jgi:hypothetical protein
LVADDYIDAIQVLASHCGGKQENTLDAIKMLDSEDKRSRQADSSSKQRRNHARNQNQPMKLVKFIFVSILDDLASFILFFSAFTAFEDAFTHIQSSVQSKLMPGNSVVTRSSIMFVIYSLELQYAGHFITTSTQPSHVVVITDVKAAIPPTGQRYWRHQASIVCLTIATPAVQSTSAPVAKYRRHSSRSFFEEDIGAISFMKYAWRMIA